MGRCVRDRPRRSDHGGIAELAQLIGEHGSALDYDLLTLTGYTLSDIGGALPWGALLHFVQHLPRDSALSRELEPTSDAERWANGAATAAILADLYDLISQFNNNMAARGTGRRARAAKPYPRPWERAKRGQRRIGSDAVSIAEFERWWNEK